MKFGGKVCGSAARQTVGWITLYMDDLKGKIDAWLYPSSGRIQFDVTCLSDIRNKIGIKSFQELEKKENNFNLGVERFGDYELHSFDLEDALCSDFDGIDYSVESDVIE